MMTTRLNVRLWFFRVIGWDGLLPFVVAFLPVAVEHLAPNRRDILDVIGLLLPVVACCIRFCIGLYHIKTNHCSPELQTLQTVIFFFGLTPLVCFDALMLLSQGPNGIVVHSWMEYLPMAGLIAVYLMFMTVAMYPGRTWVGERDDDFDSTYDDFDDQG